MGKKVCHICKEPGHFQANCPLRPGNASKWDKSSWTHAIIDNLDIDALRRYAHDSLVEEPFLAQTLREKYAYTSEGKRIPVTEGYAANEYNSILKKRKIDATDSIGSKPASCDQNCRNKKRQTVASISKAKEVEQEDDGVHRGK